VLSSVAVGVVKSLAEEFTAVREKLLDAVPIGVAITPVVFRVPSR
jgi:hypothetical protein